MDNVKALKKALKDNSVPEIQQYAATRLL